MEREYNTLNNNNNNVGEIDITIDFSNQEKDNIQIIFKKSKVFNQSNITESVNYRLDSDDELYSLFINSLDLFNASDKVEINYGAYNKNENKKKKSKKDIEEHYDDATTYVDLFELTLKDNKNSIHCIVDNMDVLKKLKDIIGSSNIKCDISNEPKR